MEINVCFEIYTSFKGPWGFKFFNKADMSQYVKDLLNILNVPDHFVTQEMCNEAVQRDPWALRYVPDQYKT